MHETFPDYNTRLPIACLYPVVIQPSSSNPLLMMSSQVDSKKAGKSETPKDPKAKKVPKGGQAPGLKDWRAKLEERKREKLDYVVPTIFDLIVDSYSSHMNAAEKQDLEEEGENPILDDIKYFLSGEGPGQEGHEGMDGCIRWHMLVKALDPKNEPKARRVGSKIGEAVLEKWPMLAVLPPSQDSGSCANPDYHKVDPDTTPFREAVNSGHHIIVNRIVSLRKGVLVPSDQRQAFINAFEAQCFPKKSSAMLLALGAKTTPIQTLKELLKIDKARTTFDCFDEALEEGSDEVINTLLANGQDLDTKKIKDSIIKAIQLLPSESAPDRERRLGIVETLVSNATEDAFDLEVVEMIIQKNLTTVWNAKAKNLPSDKIRSCLLHMAVLHQKSEFVKIFLNECSVSLSIEMALEPGRGNKGNKTDKFPLWYNNHQWISCEDKFEPITGSLERACDPPEEESERSKIRDLIVDKMIHDLDMNRLTDFLHRSLGMYNSFLINRIPSFVHLADTISFLHRAV